MSSPEALTFTVDFSESEPASFAVTFEESFPAVFNVTFGEFFQDPETAPNTYEGPYSMDPDFIPVVLPTINKMMLDDVTLNPIEVSQVENLSGGNTIYIGGIFNGSV